MTQNQRENGVFQGYVTVGAAATLLGVSVDTVRRWEKSGKISAQRLDGKNRYFLVEELEAFVSMQPLSTKEVAVLLKVSESTVRRLSNNGKLTASRDQKGKRLYDRVTVNAYMHDTEKNQFEQHLETGHSPLVHQESPLQELEYDQSGFLNSANIKAPFSGWKVGFYLVTLMLLAGVFLYTARTDTGSNLLSKFNSETKKQKALSAEEAIQLQTYFANQEHGNLAVVPITSEQIQDGTIQSVDIVNGAIQLNHLSPELQVLLKGNGDSIVTAITGPVGPEGPAGLQGPPGPAAPGASVSDVMAGLGLSGTASTGSIGLSVNTASGTQIVGDAVELRIAATGVSSATSSVSGMEISPEGLRLIGGCSSSDILKWNGSAWGCSSDIAGGSVDAKEGGATIVATTGAFDFLANDFNVANSASQANIAIDYTNSAITRRTATEIITGNWNFTDSGFTLQDNVDSAKKAVFQLAAITSGQTRTLTIPDVSGTLISSGNLSAITAVGNITSGVWQGSTIGVQYGGTGNVSFTTNGVLYGNGTGAVQVTAAGVSGQVILANGAGTPVFTTVGGDASLNGSGTLTLANSGVLAGSYGSASQAPVFTVDAKGRVTGVTNTTITGVTPGGLAGGDLSGTYPNPSVVKINGANLGATTASSGNLLVANGSSWVSTALSGDLTVNSGGVTTIQANAIALGADTTGSYISALGTLTGLTTTGNSGEGSTPTLSVAYGSAVNTAVQGSTSLIVSSGTNLSGGGTVTLGAGGTITLNTVANPVFNTSVTTPLINHIGNLDLSATGNLTLTATGGIVLSGFNCSTNDNGGVLTVNASGQVICDDDDGGAAGTITGSGTLNRVPVYTGAQGLGSSWLLQNGSTLQLDNGRNLELLGGNIIASGSVTATSFSGVGSGLTGVNATQLNGQAGSYYTNAANLTGSLADARLSTNVTLGGNAFNGITQLVQTNASGYLPMLNGSLLTSVNAAQLGGQTGSYYLDLANTTGTLGDAHLSANVTVAGNTFNGSSELVQTTAGGALPALSGALLTNINASLLNGQAAAYYTDLSNATGLLSDVRLSANVTLQGNTFNGANQLVKLSAGGALPALDGSMLTNVNAAQLNGQAGSYYTNAANLTGSLADARLSTNVTMAGNTFNGNSQLVQTTAGGLLPALNGSLVANINAVSLGGQNGSYYLDLGNATGTLAVARIADNSITNSKLQNSGLSVSLGSNLSGSNSVALGGTLSVGISATPSFSTVTAATFTGDLTGNASTAIALTTNPVDCSTDQFATAIAANGDLTCSILTDAAVPDSLTIGAGSTVADGALSSNVTKLGAAVDLDTSEVAGKLRSTSLQNAAADLGAADVEVILSNSNGSYVTNLTLDGTVTASGFVGSITGNASTATTLAANPTDCGADTYATAIAASGNLSCNSITDAALSANVTLLGSAITKDEITGSGLLGFVWSDSEVSDAITISSSGSVEDGALSANVTKLGAVIDLATTEVAGNLKATNLQNAGTDLGAANVTVDLSNTNGAFVTSLIVDGTITAATFSGSLSGTASTATALAANPTDCSVNQFATTIAANGNLSCASLTDADIPDNITVNNATNAANLLGSGSTSNAVDLDTAEVSGNLRANNLQAAAANLGAADVTVNFGNTNGTFSTNIITDGTVTAAAFIGALTGNASTATALAANPTDCSANQFATTIAANGNLTCASITDADVPDTITINLATAATVLAANPTDCSANQFATSIAANGNLTCASITDADVSDTLTASLFVGAGSTTTAIDLATAEVSGSLLATNLQNTATDLGAANVTINLSNTNGAFVTNLTTDGTVTAATFAGALTGNASTATSFASNPTDCSANQFATTIAANGNLTCASITDGDIPDTITVNNATSATNAANLVGSGSISNAVDLATAEVFGNLRANNLQTAAADLGAADVTVNFSNSNGVFNTNITTDGNITAVTFIGALTGNASTATALAANPTDCSANQFATAIVANGNLTCASLTDADIPDTITVNLSAAATALASNPTDCSANQFATTIAANGNLTCASITDADVSDTLTASLFVGSGSATTAVDLATAEVAGNLRATNLQSGAADLGAANVTVNLTNSNGAFVTNLTTDGTVTAATFAGALTGNASTATALAANPTDCSANQFATTIAANGNLTCASITDADVSDTLTASIFIGSGSVTNAIDLGTAEIAGTLQSGSVSGSYSGITGTGALDAGSITANFGGIDVGADTITTSGTIGTAASTTFTGGALTVSGTSNLNVTTLSGNLTLSSDANEGISGGGLVDCDTANNRLTWNSSTNKFGCSTLETSSFVDTTSDAVADNNTTNYWDLAAENGNQYPNITPSSSSSEIFGVVTMETTSTSTADIEVTTRIERTINGTNPTCNSSTAVGANPGTFSSNTSAQKASTVNFMDSPATTTEVRYTLCADTATSGTAANITRIRFTLFELNNAGDLAEIYSSTDTSITPGEVVSLDPSLGHGVKRTAKAYDQSAIGIVATNPALVIGGRDGEGSTGKPVALSGRVPLKVSAINGAINKGDMLTSSSIPGVAMKATKAGPIVGVAMSGFSGDGTGSVMTFVKTSYYTGANLGDIMKDASGTAVPEEGFGKAALEYFMNNVDSYAESVDLSQINTDRVTAGLEVVTPKLTTNLLQTAKLVAAPEGIQFTDEQGNLVASISNTGELKAQKLIAQSLEVSLDMFARGALTVSGVARFDGNALFNQLVTFNNSTTFNGDMNIVGRAKFNKDTGGRATLKPGQQAVHVSFTRAYEELPIINLTLGQGKFAQYSYDNVTANGFDIVLSAPANEQLQFSWTAMAVNDASNFEQ